MWKLKQIFDGEYGCEERQPGEKEKCLVILANEEGEEKTFEANEDWIAAIEKLSANPLMKIIISKPMAKDCQYKKIVVEKKGDGYQAAKYTEKQVFHDNFGAEDLQGFLMEAIHDTFLQVNAWDEKKEYSLLISKKGAVTLRAKASKEAPDTVTEHNRKKNYILDEGQVIPPLVDMGIFTGEGKVVKSMYDKFRQIYRFIEMIDDAIRSIPDFPVKLAHELKHCIVAHHGELEYGSPKKPALAEAVALNMADSTDAKLQTLTELFKGKTGTEWLGYNRLFESNLRRASED